VSDALERARRWDAAVGVDEAVARAVAEERAAVVAWLRREITKCGCDDDTAACIERGEHRREEER
jgi:hypothetical protein